MSLLDNIRRCVRRRNLGARKLTRVFFNVEITDSFKSPNVPSQLKDLLVYIAQEGVTVTDLFRKSGNSRDMRQIISDLEAGRPVNWTNYSFYTLANIAKRYLINIRGGIFGPKCEERLMRALDIPDNQLRTEAMHDVLVSMSKPIQQLLSLFFGIWFRMIYHTEVNAMSVEAVAKSVAGSVFPNNTTSVANVEHASKVMEYLITGFASSELFSRDLIDYFTHETKTSISRVERFKYEFFFPNDVLREESVRLFVKMLLDEGRKHGFHIVNDAVSKEVFERASREQPIVCCTDLLTNGNNQYNPLPASQLNHDTLYDSDVASRLHSGAAITNGDNKREIVKAGGDFIGNQNVPVPSSQPAKRPTTLSYHRSNASSTDPATFTTDYPVHQTAEKRTCVTATPLASRNDSVRRRHDVPLVGPWSDDNPGDRHRQAKVLARPAPPDHYGADNENSHPTSTSGTTSSSGYSSVKRRQLERLQKRSDWFLSPPTGLRSGGLMLLIDPKAHVAAKDTLSSIAVQHRRNPTVVPTPITPLGPSLLDAPSASTPLRTALYNQPITSSDLDDQLLDQLASVDPHRLWKLNAGGSVSTNSSSLLDEKENVGPDEDEVEVRYYIVERYYGPEMRSPFGSSSTGVVVSRQASVIHSQQH